MLDDLTLGLLWCDLLINISGTFVPLTDAMIGGCGRLWRVVDNILVFKLTTGKEGMGYGDFKLLAALGAWLGWKMLPIIILLSSLVGALVGIVLIVFSRHSFASLFWFCHIRSTWPSLCHLIK